MDALVTISAVILIAAMLASACRKATRAPASQAMRGQLRITSRTWTFIGVTEAAAVCGVATGFAAPAIGMAAAIGVALLMIGAVVAHLRVGLAGHHLVPPVALAVISVLTAAGFAGS